MNEATQQLTRTKQTDLLRKEEQLLHLILLRDTCIGMVQRRGLPCEGFVDLRKHLSHTIVFWRYATQRAKFAQDNMGFVHTIVRRYCSHYISTFGLDDLVHEGAMGLLRALDLYQPSVAKFTTYSAWWIRHAAHRAVEKKMRMVRIPTYQLSKIARLKKKEELSEEDEKFLQSMKARMQVLGDDHLKAKVDVNLEHTYDLRTVAQAVDELPSRVSQVLIFRFGLDQAGAKTLQEIGDIMGITKERVRQIEATGLEMLREMHSSDGQGEGDS